MLTDIFLWDFPITKQRISLCSQYQQQNVWFYPSPCCSMIHLNSVFSLLKFYKADAAYVSVFIPYAIFTRSEENDTAWKSEWSDRLTTYETFGVRQSRYLYRVISACLVKIFALESENDQENPVEKRIACFQQLKKSLSVMFINMEIQLS